MSRAVMKLPDVDYGGIKPKADEMITTETVGLIKMKAMNSDLMSSNDPLYRQYLDFLEATSTHAKLIVDDSNLGEGAGYFDNEDLSGEEQVVEFIIDKEYYVTSDVWAAGLFGLMYLPPSGEVSPYDEPEKLKDGEFFWSDYVYEPSIYAGDMVVVK